jgi:hypothetical protein
MTTKIQKLFVCYVPGLDQRRISPELTPKINEFRNIFPSVQIQNQPSSELLPTLLTGVNPHVHKIWQVSKRDCKSRNGLSQVADFFPDLLTTTIQCIRQLHDSSYDLGTIPTRRRRDFKLHRLKYTRRGSGGQQIVRTIGSIPTIFDLLKTNSRYIFCRDFDRGEKILSSLPSGQADFEFLEFYGLDVFSHWNLDRPIKYNAKLGLTDNFIGNLYEQCLNSGFTFILLVDHGQEPVKHHINLLEYLQNISVSEEEYLYFIDVAAARFWFKTDRAHKAIQDMLNFIRNISIYSFRDLKTFGIIFDDERFGELYAFTDPGYIFFPHDFYQPLANIYMGLRFKEQRPRLFNPRHRGCHGHLPDNPADEGYMILFDARFKPVIERMALIDFAPTILALVGNPVAPHMRGRMAFAYSS